MPLIQIALKNLNGSDIDTDNAGPTQITAEIASGNVIRVFNVEKIKEQDEKLSTTEIKASDEIEGPELTEFEKKFLDVSAELKELNSFKNSWPGYIFVLLLFSVSIVVSGDSFLVKETV